MYDEVDVAPGKPGRFIHRILFSDGVTAEIPFAIVFIHTVEWERMKKGRTLPHSA